MTAPTIIITVLLFIVEIIVPRRWVLLPYILAACFVPADQRIVISGLDFTPLRVLVLAGVIRIIVMGGNRVGFKWRSFDKLLLWWSLVGAGVYVMQWQDAGSFIYKAGVLFDCLGLFWIFRCHIRSLEDMVPVIKVFAVCAVISAMFIVIERVTHRNLFDLLGKVDTGIERGRYRCRGAFPHAIMMGLFWATLVPLQWAGWKIERNVLYIAGVVASIICVFLSSSSTPLLSLVGIGMMWMLYKYRSKGKAMVIGVCVVIFCLSLVMNNPVWHLMARVNVFSGSTGWHRFHLFDSFLKHTGEWFLLGTRSTTHWGLGLHDITNQYVWEGIKGGLMTLVLFIILLYQSVAIPGRISLRHPVTAMRWLAWGICVTVLGHIIAFWGVSYFGQINMLLYLIFAMVSCLFQESKRLQSVRHQQFDFEGNTVG